jgi:hypothetical protein
VLLDWLATVRLERSAAGEPLGVVSVATLVVAAAAGFVVARWDRTTAGAAAGVLVGGVLVGLLVVSVSGHWDAPLQPGWPGSVRRVLERGSLCPAIQALAGVVVVLARTRRPSGSIFRPS